MPGREREEGNHTFGFQRQLFYFSVALFYLPNLGLFWFFFFFVWIIALLLVLWHWVTVLWGGWQPNLLADDSPYTQRGAFFLPGDSKSFWVDREGLIPLRRETKANVGEGDFCQHKKHLFNSAIVRNTTNSACNNFKLKQTILFMCIAYRKFYHLESYQGLLNMSLETTH